MMWLGVALLICLPFAATAVPSTCVDKNSYCPTWAKSGECYKNPAYMECNCPLSCRTPALCGGLDSTCSCLLGAKQGRCNEEAYRLSCPDSCRVHMCSTKADNASSLESRLTAVETEIGNLKNLVLDLQVLVVGQDNGSGSGDTPTTVATPISKRASSPSSGGAFYVRWGRTSCPRDVNLVYKGTAGGGLSTHSGAAVNTLCLPKDPQYAHFTATMDDNSAFLYGAEYETAGRLPGFNNQDRDVPCAVCHHPTRSSTLMIPARTSCYWGLQLEYSGYLMSGRHQQAAASDFICVDTQPESRSGGERSQDGKLLYFVQGSCGSLPCPPYYSWKEITCVVCSK